MGAKATDVLDASTRAVDETAETLPELEETNFTIDTHGWYTEKREIKGRMRLVKISPEQNGFKKGAVTEYIDKGTKVQHFTWDAAMYYTKKAGKRMPTKEEWKGLIKAGKTKDILLVGGRN